jgi:hypothetical protein
MRAFLKAITPSAILKVRQRILSRRQDRKSPREIFSEIYRNKSWGGEQEDFFSGYGSHAFEAVDAYVRAVRPVISGAEVVDLGCGDFMVGRHVEPMCSSYIGCDVVPELIERNKRKFPNTEFRCLDITSDLLPAGDVVMVRQVLQHLNNKQILAFLPKLSDFKVLVLTEHLPRGAFKSNMDKPAGAGIRLHGFPASGVVLSDPPFNLACRVSATLAEVHEGDSLLRTTAHFLR